MKVFSEMSVFLFFAFAPFRIANCADLFVRTFFAFGFAFVFFMHEFFATRNEISL